MNKASVAEMKELANMMQEKFFEGAYFFEVEDDCCILPEGYKFTITMPHYSDHRVEVHVYIGIQELDSGFSEELYKNPDKLREARYIRMLDQFSTHIIKEVGEWIIHERTTQDNHKFLQYKGIFTEWGHRGFDEDERNIIEIAQVMRLSAKDKSLRLHFDKSVAPLSCFGMLDVKDAEMAYYHILKDYQMKGNGISCGHFDDPNFVVSMQFSFCSPNGAEVKVPIYRNEFLHELKDFKGTGALCYSQTIKKYLFEKVVDAIQEGKLKGEDKDYFNRRLLMMQKNQKAFSANYKKKGLA